MTHLTEHQLQRLCNGLLNDAEEEHLLEHAKHCDYCLDRMDQWFEQVNLPFVMADPLPVPETFQPELMQRIHRREAAHTILHFSVIGFFRVFIFLLTTIFSSKTNASSNAVVRDKSNPE